jgi:hypothetical protein
MAGMSSRVPVLDGSILRLSVPSTRHIQTATAMEPNEQNLTVLAQLLSQTLDPANRKQGGFLLQGSRVPRLTRRRFTLLYAIWTRLPT